ncbi:hypothetical protein BaRGS_00022740 [Batillaria attramentaria]|uniref:Uncharacterized protein n=1 Tax=Batillaria attramentaria TaxID=370345 RepID=A0ABD0KG20_9CAEN
MDHSDWGQRGHKKTFDDLNPGYLGSAGPRKNSDPKYQLWFWHADSDRPQWEEEQDNWRAPEWVERDDGEGWDFPVTGNVHNHRRGDDVGIISTVPNNVAADDNSEESTTWNWGNGWGHIKPWWLKDDYEDKSTIKPKRWTHPTRAPRFQDDGWAGLPSKWGHGQRDREDMGWGQNSVENVAEHGNDYVDYDNHKDNHNNDDYNNVNDVVDLNQQDVDIASAVGGRKVGSTSTIRCITKDGLFNEGLVEFFCWDCYSDSPLCGDSVDTVKAAYLGKTACGNTQKCFVRNDKGVIYRGCADGWTSSVIDTNYVGCRSQEMWDRTVEWCFCTASLCNGDSMQSIKDKYQPPAFEPFKVTESMAENMTSPTTPTPVPSNTTVPFKAAKTDSDHTIQKRSTTSNADNSTVSINFHVEKDTGLPSSTSTLSKATDASTGSTTSTGDWMTVEDGSDDSRKGSGAGNVKPPSERVNGTNYRALFG